MRKGQKMTDEQRKRLSEAHKGKPSSRKGVTLSDDTKKKISQSHKGQKAWNKGIPHSQEAKDKMSKAAKERMKSKDLRIEISKKLKGRKLPIETRVRMSEARIGHKTSLETREKIGKANSGENSASWKGGITPENDKIRGSMKYRLWREAVFTRDNWTCLKTGAKWGFEAHHINNFAKFPELRFSINNGITLSKEAHLEFHNIYGRENNTLEQLEEFLGRKIDYKIT